MHTGVTSTIRLILITIALTFPPATHALETPWPTNFTYGNWCGLGHPENDDRAPPPIDEIDAACQVHDFAYKNRKPWGNSAADTALTNTLTNVLARGTTWNRGANGQKAKRTQLSEKQYKVALAIIFWFTRQKYITLYSDIVNGDLTSFLKLGPSSARTAVIPAVINNKIATLLTEELSQASGVPVDKIILLRKSTQLSVEIIIGVSNNADLVIDATKAIVKGVGDTTELHVPISKLPPTILQQLTQPEALEVKPLVVKFWEKIKGWF